MTNLSINVDKAATLRQSRGGTEPDPVAAAVVALQAGADGITAHLRADRRHMQDRDIDLIRQIVTLEFNFEMAATKEMIFLGGRFNAATALEYGLVNQVVAPDELDAAVARLAAKFRSLPPRTIGVAKRIINEGYSLSMRESQDLEIDAQAELLDSPDLREAIASYLEKRQPRFVGE